MVELHISRKTVSEVFASMQDKKFLIPDYQRPYKWDEEKCETLWEDITSFHQEQQTTRGSDEYLLGTIVTCKNAENQSMIEIIDGQQRITSLLLLLRAFYKKLENKDNTDQQVIGLKNQIAPCIWDIDPISQQVTDRKKIHLESRVATDDDKTYLHDILESGQTKRSQDLYTSNYSFFYDKCNQYAQDNPTQWYFLCVTILKKCILLPIECRNDDTALTIFSRLNDRGMPLSDSDIFKARMYQVAGNNKSDFTHNWKDLTVVVKKANLSLDDLFRYYSHVLRAKNSIKSKEIGLRKFYMEHGRLEDSELMKDLTVLANFWNSINSQNENDLDNDDPQIGIESRKYLHCLSYYPNDFWKYAVSVFFYKNQRIFMSAAEKQDKAKFEDFLKNLTSFLFVKFLEKPTVNAIKDDIFQFCISIYQSDSYKLILAVDDNILKEKLSVTTTKLARSVILLKSYLHPNQEKLLPANFDVEHIFPQKWQNTNYNNWNEAEAKLYLEKFGNKVAIEKKLNIQAGNDYFGRKKAKYLTSAIAEVKDLGNYDRNDWNKEDIEKREENFVNILLTFFKQNLTA